MNKIMKKKLIIIAIMFFFWWCFPKLTQAASNVEDVKNNIKIKNQNIYKNIKGKIILKVKDSGKAYYVNPKTETIHYLGRPSDAFVVMRKQGIGITNANLEKIPVGSEEKYSQAKINVNFAKQQSGKILLQVESKREAWYVNPADNKRYFFGRPSDAFNVMKKVSVGISNEDFDNLLHQKDEVFIENVNTFINTTRVFNVKVMPDEVSKLTPATIKVTAEIYAGHLFPSSVGVYQTTETGQPIGILGQMNDDGKGLDETDGDTVFTGQFDLNMDNIAESKFYVMVTVEYAGDKNKYSSPVLDIILNKPKPETRAAVQQTITDFSKALKSGNITAALNFIVESEKARYETIFTKMGVDGMNFMGQNLESAIPIFIGYEYAEYESIITLASGEKVVSKFTLTKTYEGSWKFNQL